MANTLKATRDELALQLTSAGVTVVPFIPERIVPPVALIEPGSPYIENGETFCEFRVALSVVVLAASATNDEATSHLDQVICDVIDQVDTFLLDSVDQPGSFEVGGGQYLGTRLQFHTYKDLTTS